jgi:hypothetical protein
MVVIKRELIEGRVSNQGRPFNARGGSVSPLEEFAVEILDLIAQRPDLTLVET